MAVDESLDALSAVASSNTPGGTDTVGPDLDDHLRDIKKNIKIVGQTSQGPTAPTGFTGRQRLATSATASNTLTWQMHDGAGYVSVMDINTSNNNVSRFYAADGSVPGSAISGTASSSFLGTFSGFFDGSATGTFRGFFTGTASGVLKGDVLLDDGNSASPSMAYNTDRDTGSFLSATGAAVYVSGGNTKWKYKASGQFFIGDNANASNLAGLTINQGAADDEIFTLKSTDVGHGVTDITETDTYGFIKKLTAANGGVQFHGLTEPGASEAFQLLGYADTAITTKNTSSRGIISLVGRSVSGTAVANVDANANIFAVVARVGGVDRTVMIVDEDGDIAVDGSSTLATFDSYDDIKLLSGLRGSVMEENKAAKLGLAQWVDYARPVLEDSGIVHYNDDGRHFISDKGIKFLLIDAIRQLGQRIEDLENKLDQSTGKESAE